MTENAGKQKKSSAAGLIRLLIVAALIIAVAGTFALRADRPEAGDAHEETVAQEPALPRLVDVGAGFCIPCKKMMPILAELQEEYADRFTVVYVDVSKDRAAAGRYGVTVIPTQIFYDAQGKELFRHEGFFGKEEILKVWRDKGILAEDATPQPAES